MKPGDRIGRFEIVEGPVTTWVIGRDEKCKSALCGGSHYHCTRCGAVTSMYGHSTAEQCQGAHDRGLADPDWVSPEVTAR